MNAMQTFLPPGRVLLVLLLMDAGTGVMHLLFSTDPEMGAFFNLAHEENLPTWYSSFQFMLVACAAGYCYAVEKIIDGKEKSKVGWLVVAFFMSGLAIDETLQIHEALIDQIMSRPAGENLRYFFGANKDTDSLLWTVVFAPVLILAGTGLILFYYSRLQKDPVLFRFSLLPFFLLALSAGLEYMEAKTLSALAEESMVRYGQLTFIEEMAELFAASLLVWIHYQYATNKLRSNKQ